MLARGGPGGRAAPQYLSELQLRVGVTSHAYRLEIEGLFAHESHHGRVSGDLVGGIRDLDTVGRIPYSTHLRPNVKIKPQLLNQN